MKSYKNCEGCGVEIQLINKELPGYTPKESSNFCMSCFKSKNYGEFINDLSNFYDLNKISEIKNDNVLMIIDVLNPYETLIEKINDYVNYKNLTILVNKVDILPKSIEDESILNWIYEITVYKNIKFNKISLVSTFKKNNIDLISDFIDNSDKNTSIIGYSNVGKTSLIKALFNSKKININNLITNSIGTTKNVIKHKYGKNNIKDYPGLTLKGNYQNLMSIDELKKTNPLKEIKIRNYQLLDFQSININDFAIFSVLKSDKKLGYQFTFSNLINLHRSKFANTSFNEKFITKKINHRSGNRYDLIISGLGIITFKSIGQEINISLPENVNFKLVKSLYK